jgi:dolichol-phosphate mannosyltransferase
MPSRLTADSMPNEVFSLRRPVELTAVIPPHHKRENVVPLLAALETALVGIEWGLIFVHDSSPDGTAETIRTIAIADRRIRVLERVGRPGLSSACIERKLSIPAPFIAVLDTDLRPDESILPKTLHRMEVNQLHIVVGSCKVAGGSRGDSSRMRVLPSSLGVRLGRGVNTVFTWRRDRTRAYAGTSKC